MRFSGLLLMLLIGACSGASEPTKKEAGAPAVSQIAAGQWEMTTEVTNLIQRDKGAPAIKMDKGSRTIASLCVAEADAKQPQPALFVAEGFDCKYQDSYINAGRLNATLACSKAGLSGNIMTIVTGTFTGDTIEATTTTETSLSGEGDVRIDAKLTGRRTAACSAAPAKG